MKMFSFFFILLFSTSLTIAQTTDEVKTSFAILGGVNLQNLNGKDITGRKLKNEITIGFHHHMC